MKGCALAVLMTLVVAACSGSGPTADGFTPTNGVEPSAAPVDIGESVEQAAAGLIGERGRALLAWPAQAASLEPLGAAGAAASTRFRSTDVFGADAAIELGFTVTQDAGVVIDPGRSATTIEVLQRTLPIENQHLMGFGALNPQPSPGLFDWSSLDDRMAAIAGRGRTPVLTLCCAPDWMKGGEAGTTDWTRITVAPDPAFYDAFAALAAAAVERYPDVRHVLVWNELKGFHDPVRNEWDIEAYTELYNQVYDAVKAVDPTVQVGGPYVAMASWSDAATMSHPSTLAGPWGVVDGRALTALDYWLSNNVGADFVVVDGGTQTRDEGWLVDPGAATAKFATVSRWLADRTDLPIWWAELHGLGADAPAAGDPPLPLEAQAAIMAASIIEAARGGVDVALLWPATTEDRCHACLWTGSGDTITASPFAERLPALRYALAHVDIDAMTSPSPGVFVASSPIGAERLVVLVVNATADDLSVETPLGEQSMSPWSQLVLTENAPDIGHD